MKKGQEEIKILLRDAWRQTEKVDKDVFEIRTTLTEIARFAGILDFVPDERVEKLINCPRCER